MSLWSRVKAAFTRKEPAPAPITEVGKPSEVTAIQTFARRDGRVVLSKQLLVVPDPPYRRSTTALRRFRRDADRKYLHVSVPMTRQIVDLVAIFGERWFRKVHKGKGITYRKEKN
ncbi:hypothetical protein [Stenotrophomonas phage vB_SmaS_P15]|uniref:Uncharacterized protein n=1 Tax=Stenotrophomonas phage vB_SmaS_P15 TaxID=2894592 RepID=A0AAE8YHD2_9CAUD|nr:hypothetical protein [Stenotrophomonas phage vB_SmaS_P15]